MGAIILVVLTVVIGIPVLKALKGLWTPAKTEATYEHPTFGVTRSKYRPSRIIGRFFLVCAAAVVVFMMAVAYNSAELVVLTAIVGVIALAVTLPGVIYWLPRIVASTTYVAARGAAQVVGAKEADQYLADKRTEIQQGIEKVAKVATVVGGAIAIRSIVKEAAADLTTTTVAHATSSAGQVIDVRHPERVDLNGDGIPDPVTDHDVDRDGILDRHDLHLDHRERNSMPDWTRRHPSGVDTDRDGIPDYRDEFDGRGARPPVFAQDGNHNGIADFLEKPRHITTSKVTDDLTNEIIGTAAAAVALKEARIQELLAPGAKVKCPKCSGAVEPTASECVHCQAKLSG